MRNIIISLIILSCIPLASHANASNIEISAAAGASNLSGFTSIPLGGALGTATPHRPTFSEVGIHHTAIYDLDAVVALANFALYGDYQYIRPSGSNPISQSLLFHNSLIPANTVVNANSTFDLYRIGIKYPFYFAIHSFSIAPELEFTALDFAYHLSIPVLATSRSFVQGTPRIGLNINYHCTDALSFAFDAASSIPNLTNLDVINLTAKINYTIYNYKKATTRLFAMAGYQQIKFRDHQTLPNDIRLTMWPMAMVGLSVAFA